MSKMLFSVALAMQLLVSSAFAQEPVKIGFITTLSTSAGYIGEDLRDGFMLAVQQEDGKLGGVPVELVVEDDGLKPANAKQIASRMVESGIRLYTGVNFSNVMLAVAPTVLKEGHIYISPNTGPSVFAGKRCDPNYFVVSYQNDAYFSAGGVAADDLGYKRVVIMAPAYQGGRDALAGFKSRFNGEVLAELYTKLDQSDFSVELARIRSLAPDAIYQFHPGSAGINFVKQYASSGLNETTPIVMPDFSMDARMVVATGDASEGSYTTGIWSVTMDNPRSQKFVQDYQAAYGRAPTGYSMQAYETALWIASALKAVEGDVSQTDALRAALRKADFESIRGNFKLNVNHHPIQDIYLMRLEKDEQGELVHKVVRKIISNDADTYAASCEMPY